MTSRAMFTLAGIAVLVAGLTFVKSVRREEPATRPGPVALPQVLDFGRDT